MRVIFFLLFIVVVYMSAMGRRRCVGEIGLGSSKDEKRKKLAQLHITRTKKFQ